MQQNVVIRETQKPKLKFFIQPKIKSRYAVQGVVSTGDKPIVVVFFGNEAPLNISAKHILHIPTLATISLGHGEVCLLF